MKIRIVKVEPLKHPEVLEIEDSLENLQDIVDGFIEIHRIDDKAVILCNEDARLKGMLPNRQIYLPEPHSKNEMFFGTLAIVKSYEGEEDFTSFTLEEAKSYSAEYASPERVINRNISPISNQSLSMYDVGWRHTDYAEIRNVCGCSNDRAREIADELRYIEEMEYQEYQRKQKEKEVQDREYEHERV